MKTEPGIALAHEVSVTAWKRARDGPRLTVSGWSTKPAIRKVTEACRRRLIDQAIGRVTRRASWNLSFRGDGAEARIQGKWCCLSERRRNAGLHSLGLSFMDDVIMLPAWHGRPRFQNVCGIRLRQKSRRRSLRLSNSTNSALRNLIPASPISRIGSGSTPPTRRSLHPPL